MLYPTYLSSFSRLVERDIRPISLVNVLRGKSTASKAVQPPSIPPPASFKTASNSFSSSSSSSSSSKIRAFVPLPNLPRLLHFFPRTHPSTQNPISSTQNPISSNQNPISSNPSINSSGDSGVISSCFFSNDPSSSFPSPTFPPRFPRYL